MTEVTMTRTRLPAWLNLVAAFGVAWNVFGLVQLADFITQTRDSLMLKGMTVAAAELYLALPVWMKLAFTVGSVGGVVGSIALALRHRSAVPVLTASLVGYVALWAGDYAYGVFDVIPGQMAIVSLVVAMAAALLVAGVLEDRRYAPPLARNNPLTLASPQRFEKSEN